jgi:hypothetical protein
MVAHDGFFSYLKPNTRASMNFMYSHIELDESWDQTFFQVNVHLWS